MKEEEEEEEEKNMTIFTKFHGELLMIISDYLLYVIIHWYTKSLKADL